jgi:hypothetical protein
MSRSGRIAPRIRERSELGASFADRIKYIDSFSLLRSGFDKVSLESGKSAERRYHKLALWSGRIAPRIRERSELGAGFADRIKDIE